MVDAHLDVKESQRFPPENSPMRRLVYRCKKAFRTPVLLLQSLQWSLYLIAAKNMSLVPSARLRDRPGMAQCSAERLFLARFSPPFLYFPVWASPSQAFPPQSSYMGCPTTNLL